MPFTYTAIASIKRASGFLAVDFDFTSTATTTHDVCRDARREVWGMFGPNEGIESFTIISVDGIPVVDL